MKRVTAPGPVAPRRAGKYLIMLAWILPVLFGMTGLTIDAGWLLAVERQAQNAADAAALTVAEDLLRGRISPSDSAAATSTARTHVQKQNELPTATVSAQVGPLAGPYQGNSRYVEVTVSVPVQTYFIQVLNLMPGSDFKIDSSQIAYARAVAGYEATDVQHQITLLSPNSVDNADPGGLDVNNLPLQPNRLVVPGGIAVNSEGGLSGSKDPSSFALRSRNVEVRSSAVRTVGEVDGTSNFKDADGTATSPPITKSLPVADPLNGLPTPTTSNGVVNRYPGPDGNYYDSPQPISLTPADGETITLNPGIYESIKVVQGTGGTVKFNPGIYVLKGGTGGTALQIDLPQGSVVGQGVMFYNTGSTYDPISGGPDASDTALASGVTDDATFGDVSIKARSLDLSGPGDSSVPNSSNSTFDGMLLYQRRANPSKVEITAFPRDNNVAGTIYAKGAQVKLNGATNYQSQVIAGGMMVGKADLVFNIDFAKPTAHRPLQVFLVE